MSKYLFILSPPYSGSTVLWRLLGTSPHVSTFEQEGQFLDSVNGLMRDPWNGEKQFPWEYIKRQWDEAWDRNSPILLEKSPPNLVRAFEIEQVFIPCYFVIINRDPYAFCEGMVRRMGNTVEQAARFWARCAALQIKNLEGLQHSMYFTYEAFTANPAQISQQLLDFLPELEHLDPGESFTAQAVVGYDSRPITNLNQVKIDLLSPKELERINSVLQQHADLMRFWGYEYIRPSQDHLVRHYKAVLSVQLTRLRGRMSRLFQRFATRVW